ncbi:MAG: DUF1840 domain-containing protein [Porticoccus sp.]|nr:DUF1840 domain-containing protein [Porticoccus sp.]
MLVTFHTSAAGDVVMFGDIAVQLLQLMGQSGKVPGVLQPEGLPQAIRLLKTAVEDHSFSDTGVDLIHESENNDETEDDEPKVSLQNRAFPLIQLLEAAEREEVQVAWES